MIASLLVLASAAISVGTPSYDVLITHAMIYDGSGAPPYPGELAIQGDRIAYVGKQAPPGRANRVMDAKGLAVSPGFINMLAHPEESLLADGRGLSDLVQGVTLEVMGESSMGPLSHEMAVEQRNRQGDIRYNVDWTTLDQYLRKLEAQGVSPNVASFVGAGTVRENVLGARNVPPSPSQLDRMKMLVREAMEDGALGLTAALIYTPDTYAATPELIALATESGRCGGIYAVHIRSEGDRLLEAADETIAIARASGAPAEIYHLKAFGRDNWEKLAPLIAKIESARSSGVRITADLYPYLAAATGLNAAMPPWVQEGGFDAWVARLENPEIRARVISEMRTKPKDWESALNASGPDRTRLLAFKSEKLRPLMGKSLTEVARMRGTSPEDAAIDLVIEDGSRVEVAYFAMTEDNIRREAALPWVSFGSDEEAPAPEGDFLKTNHHPRAYGTFARIFANYAGPGGPLTVQEAVRKMTSLPAGTLSILNRGRLIAGNFADVVIFDASAMKDHSTFERPHQLATGVRDVFVNGRLAIENGLPTGASSGRVVRGRGWKGNPGGGCRQHASDWTWSK